MSRAAAQPIVKIEDPKIPINSGHRRPMSSDPGAQINGPEANPSTKRLVPNAVTSCPTEKVWLDWAAPAAKMALLKEATKVALHAAVEM